MLSVKDDKRLYKRLWSRVKNAKTPEEKRVAEIELRKQFNTISHLPREELERREHERHKRDSDNLKSELHSLYERLYGRHCYICGTLVTIKGEKTNRVIRRMHRKDGTRHPKEFRWMLREIELHGERYVQLCKWCHQNVHFCMKRLGMKWNDIDERLKYHYRHQNNDPEV